MAKKVAQFRYYSNGDIRNYPNGVVAKNFVSGKVFNGYYPIKQLGIQTLPGVEFHLNNGITPITIGYTGIYELELDDVSDITSLTFNAKSMNLLSQNPSAYLIIDIIYEEEDII